MPTKSFTVDRTAPGINLISSPPTTTSDTNATFDFSGTDPVVNGASSGVKYYEYSLDGSAFIRTAAAPVALSGLSRTAHTFQIRAVDSAGNVGLPTSYSWTVSLIPTTTSVVGTPQATTGGSLIQFTATIQSNPTADAGTVIFYDGAIPISGSVAVQNGVALFQTTSISALGEHSIRATYSGDVATGFAGSTSSPFTQTIVSPPTLVSTVLNGATPELRNLPAPFADQHSTVRSIQLTFSTPVVLAADAVGLAIHSNSLVVGSLPGTVLITNSTGGMGHDAVWNVTFSGANVVGGSIADGEYDLAIDSSKVSDVFGQHPTSALPTYTFYRLLGDADGNRTVNNIDIANVRRQFGKTQTAPDYLWLFDADWNGTVNTLDVIAFRRGLGRTI